MFQFRHQIGRRDGNLVVTQTTLIVLFLHFVLWIFVILTEGIAFAFVIIIVGRCVLTIRIHYHFLMTVLTV